MSATIPLTFAATWAYVGAIPEPQTWLGLLAGLPLLVYAARRRRAGP